MRKTLLLIFFATMLCIKYATAQDVAPNFTIADIEGIEFSLNDYRGKTVLLDFFALWCSSCLDEIPQLKSLHQEFGEDLIIISISVSPSTDTIEKLQQFRQEYVIDWIVAIDTAGINEKYNVQSIPTLIIIDQEGYIRHRHIGLTEESALRKEISEIIPEFETWTLVFTFLTLTVVAIICKKLARSSKARRSDAPLIA